MALCGQSTGGESLDKGGPGATGAQARSALVDESSFFAQGVFRESAVERIQPGMPVVVTLMTQPRAAPDGLGG